MFRAELRWMANGLTLKMDGKLVGEWAEEAMRLITTRVVPKGLIVDLTDVCYVDSAGECLLSWLASVGAVFEANDVYATDLCDRLGLPGKQRILSTRTIKQQNPATMHSILCDTGPKPRQEEEK